MKAFREGESERECEGDGEGEFRTQPRGNAGLGLSPLAPKPASPGGQNFLCVATGVEQGQ
jgi:hypothetical protein